MPLREFTTNDRDTTQGGKIYHYEYVAFQPFVNATSAATGSATLVLPTTGVVKASGEVCGFVINVNGPALSASGFVSATISANLRINSVSCLTVLPGVSGPASASAGFAFRTISGTVNPASARVNPGDQITLDYNCQSGGSAAAGAAAIGFSAFAIVRYDAV